MGEHTRRKVNELGIQLVSDQNRQSTERGTGFPTSTSEVGKRLKVLIDQLGIPEATRISGKSASTLSRWMDDPDQANLMAVSRLCHAAGTTLDALLGAPAVVSAPHDLTDEDRLAAMQAALHMLEAQYSVSGIRVSDFTARAMCILAAYDYGLSEVRANRHPDDHEIVRLRETASENYQNVVKSVLRTMR